MSEWLKFKIDHRPVPQPRVRVGSKGAGYKKGHPVKTFKEMIRYRAAELKPARWRMNGAFEVGLTCYVKPFKSQLMSRGLLACDSKADNDNLEKACWDALSGVLFHDDRQVVINHCLKIIALEDPYVFISVRRLPDLEVPALYEWSDYA